MIELNPLVSISKEVRAWFETNKNVENKKKDEMKLAIKVLSKAILETKSYVRNGFDNRIQERENELRELWNNAHIELRQIDADLAMRCFAKAEYWTEPENWSGEKIEKYNIKLDSMSESLKTLE